VKIFFSYYGGKYRCAPHYSAPEFDTIIEPFAGSAGYSVRHYAKNVILVDKDEKVAMLWDYLINVSSQEIMSLPDIASGTTVDEYNLSEEQKYLVGFWLNKGSAAPCKMPSKWMRTGSGLFWGANVRDRIASNVENIRHWKIIHGSYEDAPDMPATWFVDPPYQAAGKHYRHSSNNIDFAALGDWCRSRTGQVMVCENEGASWLPFIPFRSIKGTHGKTRSGVSVEVLWTNDPPLQSAAL
jgi:site-specific DNA-adenine methylase